MKNLGKITATIEWKRSMDLAISMHQVTCQMLNEKNGSKELAERLLQSVFKIETRITESYHSWVFTQSELFCMARYHLAETEFYLECAFRYKCIGYSDYVRLLSDIVHVRNLLNERIDQLQKKKRLLVH